MTKIYLVFQDPFDCGVIPSVSRSCRAFLAEVVSVQHPVFQRGDAAFVT